MLTGSGAKHMSNILNIRTSEHSHKTSTRHQKRAAIESVVTIMVIRSVCGKMQAGPENDMNSGIFCPDYEIHTVHES